MRQQYKWIVVRFLSRGETVFQKGWEGARKEKERKCLTIICPRKFRQRENTVRPNLEKLFHARGIGLTVRGPGKFPTSESPRNCRVKALQVQILGKYHKDTGV